MRLVVDASILVSEALRTRGRRLLADAALDLAVAADMWNETVHELDKRVDLLASRGHLQPEEWQALLGEIEPILIDRLTIVSRDVYVDRLGEARLRIPRDPNDAPTVALALCLDCGIWTSDRDFFGCGLPVWTTETLLGYLAHG